MRNATLDAIRNALILNAASILADMFDDDDTPDLESEYANGALTMAIHLAGYDDDGSEERAAIIARFHQLRAL